MTLPASGAISLNNVNVELGLSGTTTISMNQASVRTLFGVPSGAIAMSDGYGKSNQFAFTISSNQTNANLRTLALNAGWPGTAKVVATINSGIYISSNSTGTPALTVNGSFPGGVELINNGTIVGMGGAGGAGTPGGFGSGGGAGSSGGTALSVSVALTLNNLNTLAGGGGGGGGGAFTQAVVGKSQTNIGGSGGGGGRSSNAANSSGGTATPSGSYAIGNNGSAGTVSAGGSGGAGRSTGGYIGTSGGNGGNWGATGASGANGSPVTYGGNGAGGGGGNCVTGNSNITYINTGTRLGGIS